MFKRSLLAALLFLTSCACLQRPQEPIGLLDYAVKVSVAFVSPDNHAHLASGSGTVFYSKHGTALVLTADHVCSVSAEFKVLSIHKVIGPELPAQILWENKVDDLCVLKVDGYSGPAAPLARDLPPLGQMVYFPGGPLGMFGDGVGFLEQAHYAGLSPVPMAGARRLLLGGVTTHGMSGAGVFYRGHIVGTVIAIASESGYIVIAAELSSVREAVVAGYSALAKRR